jgi:hypothetical protein
MGILRTVPYTSGISTTEIFRRLEQRASETLPKDGSPRTS